MLKLLMSLVGSSVCSAGVSNIPNLADAQGPGVEARCGARWNPNLDVETREATILFSATGDKWNGNCANTRYEGRWNQVSGDAPTTSTGADGVWHTMDSEVMVGYDTTAPGHNPIGSFTFELRLVSNPAVILTDAFTMNANEASA